MFGKKKNNLIENLLNNQLTTPENKQSYKFYDFDNNIQRRIELQAILNSDHQKKILLFIDSKSSIDYLSIKIAEIMEKFQEYENLDGLKAINLSKKVDKNNTILIPARGEIKDYIFDGDVIFFDLFSKEFWIHTKIIMKSSLSNLSVNLDIKFKDDTIIKKFKLILIKLGLNFWIDFTSNSKEKNNYIISKIEYNTSKLKNYFNLNTNEINENQSSINLEDCKILFIFNFS